MNEELKRICDHFDVVGEFLSYEEIKNGNVNHTYRVEYLSPKGKQKSYILQKVNTYAFHHPVEIMENIDLITEHIHAKQPKRTALHFHHTPEGKTYLFDDSGFWRLFNYIESDTFNDCENLEVVRNAGEAFGEFQFLLSDINVSKVYDTTPGFHDTRKRYAKMIADMKEDPLGRVAEVREELDFLLAEQDRACQITDLYNAGALPLRVAHNDTKINNVLFEKDTHKALVVIDLDTIMPGLISHDFGDAIRYAANVVAEDCPDCDKVAVNMDVFRAFADGFLSQTADILTEREIDTLAVSGYVLACELATRFLDDYIIGDPYFHIGYPTHNLVRTRCQIAFAKKLLEKQDEMDAIIRECVQKYRGAKHE